MNIVVKLYDPDRYTRYIRQIIINIHIICTQPGIFKHHLAYLDTKTHSNLRKSFLRGNHSVILENETKFI